MIGSAGVSGYVAAFRTSLWLIVMLTAACAASAAGCGAPAAMAAPAAAICCCRRCCCCAIGCVCCSTPNVIRCCTSAPGCPYSPLLPYPSWGLRPFFSVEWLWQQSMTPAASSNVKLSCGLQERFINRWCTCIRRADAKVTCVLVAHGTAAQAAPPARALVSDVTPRSACQLSSRWPSARFPGNQATGSRDGTRCIMAPACSRLRNTSSKSPHLIQDAWGSQRPMAGVEPACLMPQGRIVAGAAVAAPAARKAAGRGFWNKD